ncbi:MAG: hypothetical protein ACE5E5_11060 [Phycisphaerae bacterium]
MKSERRHELRESDLAHAIETGKRYLGGHGKRVGILALAVIAAIVGTNVVLSSRASDATDRWQKLWVLAFDTPEVSRQSMGTMLALAESGDDALALRALLNRGSRALTEASKGETLDLEFNKIARDSFEKLLSRFGDNPIAKGVGHLGLATCAENDFAADSDPSHKAIASRHLSAVLNDETLHAMPFYKVALARQERLDEIFKTVVFAPPLPPEESAEEAAKTGDAAATPPVSVSFTPTPPDAAPPAANEKAESGKPSEPDAKTPPPTEGDQ